MTDERVQDIARRLEEAGIGTDDVAILVQLEAENDGIDIGELQSVVRGYELIEVV